ncbi:Gfo/Idh/MocA family protein [Caulobacter sp. S45]|uniref:Gfo/Idh/MocA family protein n=1 Tax=Caulobacter sp. S45 TaxID=1641861 RepID=UPI0020B1756E|nr:Gfo/Idh/MocA family oxidoreductase [Caulobacter sp. S45]
MSSDAAGGSEVKGEMDQLKAGVVGAGVFGGFHARKYAELEGVAFVGVFDPHQDRAQTLAETWGGQAFPTLEALLDACHVVTIASPAETHAVTASRALDRGRHVYVEKPLAVNERSGQALVEKAEDVRLVLACGHQERVMFEAMGLLNTPETPIRLESVRRGLPSPRSRDVSCVLDLMIHDLDLAVRLAESGVMEYGALEVRAEGVFDEVRAEATFRSGLKAVFSASRIADKRERTMRLVYPSGEVEIDFLAPSFRNTTSFALNPDFASTPAGRDPLGTSVSAFLATVRGERPRPVVDGIEGLEALRLALMVEEAAGLR